MVDNLKREWVVNEAMGKYRGINHNWAREKLENLDGK